MCLKRPAAGGGFLAMTVADIVASSVVIERSLCHSRARAAAATSISNQAIRWCTRAIVVLVAFWVVLIV